MTEDAVDVVVSADDAAISVNDYIAGAIGGISGLVVGHPLDTTKVHMQTQSQPTHRIRQAFSTVYQHGLAGGLMRGLSLPVLSYGLVNSVLFGVYGNTLELVQQQQQQQQHRHREPASTSLIADELQRLKPIAMAGCAAGVAQLTVACPVDVVKVVLQSQLGSKDTRISGKTQHFTGPIECLREIYSHGGLKRCYRGLGVMALRDVPASVLYFTSFDFIYRHLQRGNLENNGRHFGISLISGGLAGVLSWFCIVPIDVVKSRFQADYAARRFKFGAWRCFLGLLADTKIHGFLRTFYVGVAPCLLRAFPVNAVTFAVSFEMLDILNAKTRKVD